MSGKYLLDTLPENDIWIAALALQHNLILVTRDAHFQEIEQMARSSCKQRF